MAIVGFSFTKLLAEKKGAARGKVQINNNVAIKEVSDANLNVVGEKKGVRVHFEFQTKYNPNIGTLSFEGDVILLEDGKVAQKIHDTWKKEQHLPREYTTVILNHILDRANIQAIIMARDLGLPSPIPMPKVNMKKKSGEKATGEKKSGEKVKKK